MVPPIQDESLGAPTPILVAAVAVRGDRGPAAAAQGDCALAAAHRDAGTVEDHGRSPHQQGTVGADGDGDRARRALNNRRVAPEYGAELG